MTKILIVDSDEHAATDIGGHLRHMGFRVDYATSGEECLKRIKKYTPNIIISEVDLPETDGVSLLKTLKQSDKTKDIPVLFLTNVDDQKKRSDAARLGVTVYFIKSKTSKDILVNWIQELIATNTGSIGESENKKEKTKVLLVEDDPLMVNLYQKVLNYYGFEVDTAIDGKLGLEKVKKNIPGLILLDILMPQQNGIEMLKKLKSDPSLKDIPVIMLTNLSGKRYAKESLALGAKDYIVKSERKPNELIEIVNRVLKEKELGEN